MLQEPTECNRRSREEKLLDYNEDRSLTLPVKNGDISDSLTTDKMTTINFDPSEDFQHGQSRIQIGTLSNYAGFGRGSYKMTSVKRMTATKAFLDMPSQNRGCNVELFQDCRTRRLLKACNCVPWEILLDNIPSTTGTSKGAPPKDKPALNQSQPTTSTVRPPVKDYMPMSH